MTDQFHPYLYGGKFTLRTDNQPLSWLKSLQKHSMRIANRILKLQEYHFPIKHRAGERHRNADALSRLPLSALHLDSGPLVELRVKQLDDPSIGPVMMAIENGKDVALQRNSSRELADMAKNRTHFSVKSGILVREMDDRGNSVSQTIVPNELRGDILKALHDDPTAAHFSKEKMISKIKQRYFWFGMSTAAENYCKQCVKCKERKRTGPAPVAEMKSIPMTGPFDLVSMDICGPYKVSADGNKYILVVSDHLTKWVECYPMKNQEASTIAEKFDDYVSRYGVQKRVITDQGRNVESRLMQELCLRYGIDKRTTSAYHPQTDGQTERFNRTMNDMLAQYVSKDEKDWDRWLPSVLFGYRTASHSSTGKSPFELLYGRCARLPIETKIPIVRDDEQAIPPQEYYSIAKDTIHHSQQQACEALRAAQSRQKTQYDKRVTVQELDL